MFKDYFTIKNSLKIDTPYRLKTIKSRYNHLIELGSIYIVGLDLDLLDGDWAQFGILTNYTKTTEEIDLKRHDLLIRLKTPLRHLKQVTLRGTIELEDTIYRGNVSAKTLDTDLSFAGTYEV